MSPAGSERGPLVFYGLAFEQFEYRFGDETDLLAWHGDAFIGTDEWKLRWQTEGEFAKAEDIFETSGESTLFSMA